MTPQDDPTISSIRETRHIISEECGHDPQTLVNHYLKLQEQYEGHLLTREDLLQREEAGRRIKEIYEQMTAKYGVMSDSAELIREDRER